jgi:hypothetical protein
MNAADNQDAEFEAMRTVFDALNPLPEDARLRVVNYTLSRLNIQATTKSAGQTNRGSDGKRDDDAGETSDESSKDGEPQYSTFAELFDATQPTTTADKALVAGYWLQVCQGNESFTGLQVNNELKHLGHALPNVTNAIESLKGQSPALALQLKKSGNSQQARKTYKITVSGIRAVEGMANGS